MAIASSSRTCPSCKAELKSAPSQVMGGELGFCDKCGCTWAAHPSKGRLIRLDVKGVCETFPRVR